MQIIFIHSREVWAQPFPVRHRRTLFFVLYSKLIDVPGFATMFSIRSHYWERSRELIVRELFIRWIPAEQCTADMLGVTMKYQLL